MGTQTNIAKAIRKRGADYVLCVKDNHPSLVDSFQLAQAGVGGVLTTSSTSETIDEGHGPREIRRCWAFDQIDRLYKAEQWQDLASFAIVERERTVGTKTSTEKRYYISSLPADAARIARAVRSHWEVENRLHWCLDGVPQKHGMEVRRERTDGAEATWKMRVGPSESAFRSRLQTTPSCCV